MDERLVRNYLIYNEGWKPETYKDTSATHIPTVGVGINLNREDSADRLGEVGADYDAVLDHKQSLTTAQILALLDQDMIVAQRTAKLIFPMFDTFDVIRQTILVDLAFNLGFPKLSEFHKMIAAVNSSEKDKWEKAAAELKHSNWYDQVGDRGPRNVKALKTGIMPHFHGGGVWDILK